MTCGLAALVFCLPGAAPLLAQARQDVVHLERESQTIENFGASDCWSMQKIGAWSEATKNRVADLLFSQTVGIGLSCWRFNIGAGINTQSIGHPWRTVETFEVAEGKYDWSRQAEERWFLRAAKARGVPQFLAFVNSPPARMTRNGLTNCTDGLGSTNLKPGFEGQYARYLVDILKHFRDNPIPAERIGFDYLSPVNEPQYEWNGPGCNQEGNRASNDDIVRILLALDAELTRQGVRTAITALESGKIPSMHEVEWTNDHMRGKYGASYGDYIWQFVTDPNASGVHSVMGRRISYHSYGSDDPKTQLLEDRRKLRDELDWLAAGWNVWMTEFCILEHGRDLTINTALRVARVVHCDLTVARASAWQWWTAVSPEDYKDGLIYTNYRNPGDAETIFPSKTLWILGNFSRFIRPGMKRVEVDGAGDDVNGVLVSAYKDEEARRIVVVYVNMGDSAVGAQIQLTGLDQGFALGPIMPYVTSGRTGDDLKLYPSFPLGRVYTIPGRSVVTLVADYGPSFLRGDTNGDGLVDMSDAVTTLGFLFLGSRAPACPDSADSNDSGAVDLSDAVYILSFLFSGGPAPRDPFGSCGSDPTPDGLDCTAQSTCEPN